MPRPPVEIIAEIANAHQGDPQQAIALAEAALRAGADAVKFQLYSADELLVRAHPRYEHFRKQAFPPDAWRDILARFVDGPARVYCDVFGLDALRIATDAGVRDFKVHSSDLANEHLLRALADLPCRLLLAVGGSTAREIVAALRLLLPSRSRADLVLLHGFQSYPTAVEDSSLSRLTWLREHFGDRVSIGYMDHVSGDDPFAFTLPLMALALGAEVLEKHITLDRAAQGVDYYSSLEPDEFARFVTAVRAAERALGDNPESFAPAERTYRKTMKKHWVAARALPAGHELAPADLVMKRVPASDSDCLPLDHLIGRRLLRDRAPEDALTRLDVETSVWALVVARMRSARLPGKALVDVGGMPALQHLFERLRQARRVNHIVLCTTTESEDEPLVRLAERCGVACFRGPVEDVLGRMVGAIDGRRVDLALRVTGDDILIAPEYVDRAVEHVLRTGAQYADLKQLPSGTEVEVFDAALLRDIWRAACDPGGTEYLTTYVVRHADQFTAVSVPVDERHARRWRLTLDTPDDLAAIRALLEGMRARGKPLDYRMDDVVDFLESHPDVLALNTSQRQRATPPEVNTDLSWPRLL